MEQDFSMDSSVGTQNRTEGKFTKNIERQTSKLPSSVYLGLAAGSVLISAALALSERRRGLANFVGLWVPSILLLGVYNKIVKTQGSDQSERTTIH